MEFLNSSPKEVFMELSQLRRAQYMGIRVIGLMYVLVPLFGQGDFEKGISYYKQQQYNKAIEEFELIVDSHPNYEDGFRILGISYLKTDQPIKAIKAFNKALELRDDIYGSHQGLGIAYYNNGNYRKSIAALLQAEQHSKSPSDRYQLYHTRGSAYFNVSMYDQAISDLEKAVSIRRGQFADVLQLGLAYYSQKKYEQAHKYLKMALGLDPDSAEAKNYISRISYNRGVSLLEKGDYTQAISVLAEYVSDESGDGDAWFNLGLAQLFSDHLQAAHQAFLKSKEIAPNRWEIYNRLAYIYEIRKQFEKALDHYKKAHSLNQDGEIQLSIERIEERIRRQRQGS